ncbi:hypothetical protein ES703_11799 [subsurface metagenome]
MNGEENTPEVEPKPEPEKTTVSLNLELPIEINERLKALAELWRMSKKQAAQKLLTETIKHRAGLRGV